MLRVKRASSSHTPPTYLFDRPVAFGSGLRGSSTLAWQALLFVNRREGVGILPQERARASRPPDGPRVHSSDGRPSDKKLGCASELHPGLEALANRASESPRVSRRAPPGRKTPPPS